MTELDGRHPRAARRVCERAITQPLGDVHLQAYALTVTFVNDVAAAQTLVAAHADNWPRTMVTTAAEHMVRAADRELTPVAQAALRATAQYQVGPALYDW